MKESRLCEILGYFDRARILVVGDFFLDKYLVLEAELTEVSLETGLDAYQVVEKRLFPGAAGTITSNLKALDAGAVFALGMIGIDGEGYELRAGLEATGVVTETLIETPARLTPTYIKPMLRSDNIERELNRLDIKNRQPCPEKVEQEIIRRLKEMVPQVNAVIVADQVQERNFGVITDAVRQELMALSQKHTDVAFLADSRVRIGEYRHLCIKPNRLEACRALHDAATECTSLPDLATVGKVLYARNARPVFITLAEAGILAVEEDATWHIPTLLQTGPLDIVGAGDSVMAGIALSLCSGASPVEAAVVGNLVASITVQQLGVTGTASRSQVLQRFRESSEHFQPRSLTP